MPLDEYRRKRDFEKTPEPAGAANDSSPQLSFVVQKHAARRLHYDLRLEWGGVLKSWAVPKGPALDPSEKRLAVEVEDHPLEYGDFEGTIPHGEYGGGTVIVWDRGTWRPEGDAAASFEKGQLKFELEGQKLRGRWMLVRLKPRHGEKRNNWLLFKERDAEARPLGEYDVLDERPESALSGRTIAEVGESPNRTWSSRQKQETTSSRGGRRVAQGSRTSAARAARPRRERRIEIDAGGLPRAVAAPFLAFFPPQLARQAPSAPEGDRWLHEIKFDGYRLMLFLNSGKVTLRTRKGIDWTERFPELRDAVAALPVKQAILDGEIVSLLPGGASNFAELLRTLTAKNSGKLVFFAFDLLYLDGYDLRRTPLIRRKETLRTILEAARQRRLQYADHLQGDGPAFFEQCCRAGLEGSMSKRADGVYQSGRTDDWLKMKSVQGGEFVIGGFSDSTSNRREMGAILVGGYNAAGELMFAGKVGSGFNEEALTDVRERLKAREQPVSPFADLSAREAERGSHFVRPELVAQVEFAGWSVDGLLWHPRFQGLREDKPAAEVMLERPEGVTRGKEGGVAKRLERTGGRRGKSTSVEAPDRLKAELQTKAEPQTSDALIGALDRVRFTNPERILYPDWGVTKIGLATFYAEIADWILPHVVNRPLSIVRCPAGSGKKTFYQKHASPGMPDTIRIIMLGEGEERESHLVIDDLAGLLSLVQLGVLEIHPWGARADEPDRPDRIIFDLDPDPAVTWPLAIEGANEVRQRLTDLGLVSFLKTTGGKGLHIVVPVQRRNTWDEVKQFSNAVAAQMTADSPSRYTASPSKAVRKGRIYIDWLRNRREATAVAAYSTRARPGATVSTPLDWDELTTAIRADQFHVGNVAARLAALDRDPWEEIASVRQSLTAKVRKAVGM